MARVRGRPASTVSRELRRNATSTGSYCAQSARAAHLYTAIYALPRGELRRRLIACLRQGNHTRMPRSRGTDRRGQIPEMVSIHARPPEVDDRVMPGHWEGDLIKCAGNKSAVGVLAERSSRLVLLARMPDSTAASALAAFTAKLESIAAPMRQSLTHDQGKEMTRHAELAARTGVRVYFCDPHSPWQRGTYKVPAEGLERSQLENVCSTESLGNTRRLPHQRH